MTLGLADVAVARAMLNGLRNVAFQNAATYVELHTADPGTGATGVSAGSVTRLAATFNSASGAGGLSLTGNIGPWSHTGSVDLNEVITHVAIWTAATVGTFLWSVQLNTPKPWVTGDTLTLTTLGVSLAPLAAS